MPTEASFLYLTVVINAFSRRVVGWAMESHLWSELVLAALEMAVRQRRTERILHHSARGSQYTSITFGERCRKAEVRLSMGASCYDNALRESFVATLECELIDREQLTTRTEAQLAVSSLSKAGTHLHRIHSALDYQSPMTYEEQHQSLVAA